MTSLDMTITELRHAVETNEASAAVHFARSAHHQARADSYDLDDPENIAPWFNAAQTALTEKRNAIACRLAVAASRRELDSLRRDHSDD